MTALERLIEKFLTDKNHITVEDCRKLLEAYEFTFHKKGGSHHTFHKVDYVPITVAVPKNSKYVKIAYVNLIIKNLKLGE